MIPCVLVDVKVSRRRRVVGYLPFDGDDGSASTGAPAWPRSPSASVAIDWDVAVTLARPSFQPLYGSTLLFIVAPAATASIWGGYLFRPDAQD